MEPLLWRLERFPEFLEARRTLIARKINEYMATLVAEPEVVYKRPIQELIGLGESATLEFKSTLQWDVVQNQVNKALRKQVLKTVAAFLNSEGGTLVIGVEDNGGAYGLDRDLASLENSVDRFLNLLVTLITDYIGAEFSSMIKTRFERLDGHQICVLDVDRAPIPAYLRGEQGAEFFVRTGNTSRLLDSAETVRYIAMHWD
jgi:predicted HTH transcriptional regulator